MPGQYNVKLKSEENLSSGNKAENTLAETVQAEKKSTRLLRLKKKLINPPPHKTHTHTHTKFFARNMSS